MVLAEKNGDGGNCNSGTSASRNGRRSRGPSPNGNAQVDSSSDEDTTVPVDKIRVGRDYQAICPELQAEAMRKPELIADRALLVWSPTADIADTKLEDYIILAKDKFGYNGEQALGMLFWHKHDLDRAVLDLANFTPFPDEWSVEDKVLFEQAFQFHGKSFQRIKQMLPDKIIGSLVKYYYSWKKTRSRTSLMDKQARKLNNPREEGAPSEGGSDAGSNEESDHDEKKWTIHRGIRRKSGSPLRSGVGADDVNSQGEQKTAGGSVTLGHGNPSNCTNCGVGCTFIHTMPKGAQCNSCFLHWRRTGSMRPTHGPSTTSAGIGGMGNGGGGGGGSGSGCGRRTTSGGGSVPLGARHKRRPPRGMYINHDDLAAMATSGAGNVMLKALAREQDALQRQIQQNKQSISSLKRKHSDSIEDLRPGPDNNATRINSRWTNDELLLAVQGVRKYGKDFKSIAEVLGNKTEHHVRAFFVNYRKRYNLDTVLQAYEREKGNTGGGVGAGLDDGACTLAATTASQPETTPTVAILPTKTTASNAAGVKKDDEVKTINLLDDDDDDDVVMQEPVQQADTSNNSSNDVICLSPTPPPLLSAGGVVLTTKKDLNRESATGGGVAIAMSSVGDTIAPKVALSQTAK